jgi:hypothetical protein
VTKVQPIYSDNPGAIANAVYTLPPGLDLELHSVRVRADTAGAAITTQLVCEILTSDDRIMAQSPIEQDLAVGDTIAGSWAPFLRHAATSTPPPPSSSSIMYAYSSLTNYAVGAGSTHVDWSSLSGDYDPAFFDLNGSGDLTILDEGVYIVTWTSGGYTLTVNRTTWATWDVNQTAGTNLRISSDVSGAPDESFAAPILRADDPATVYNYVNQQSPDGWFTACSKTGDSTPQTVRWDVTITEDNVDISGTPDFRLTVLRLGSVFV